MAMLKGGPLRHTFHPGSPLKQSAPRKLSHASLDPTRAKWWRPWKADQKNHGDHGVWWVHVIKCSNRWWVPLHYHKNITINSSMYDIYIYIYIIYTYTLCIYIYICMTYVDSPTIMVYRYDMLLLLTLLVLSTLNWLSSTFTSYFPKQ